MDALVLRTVAFVALAALVFFPLEALAPARGAEPLDAATVRAERRLSLLFATASELLARVLLVVVAGASLAWLERFAPERAWLPDSPLGRLAEVVLGLLLVGTAGYWFHRLCHEVPWLWRLHKVHHAAEHMEHLVGFRRHPLEVLLATLVQNAPVVLAGIPLGAHVGVIVALRVLNLYAHADLHVPASPLDQLLVCPRLHHRHHARARPGANYANLFPFLDRLFGTYDDCDHGEARRFGLDEEVPRSLLGQLAWPFRAARSSPEPD